MNGFDACRQLRAEDATRSTPILLVTSRSDVAPAGASCRRRPNTSCQASYPLLPELTMVTASRPASWSISSTARGAR